MPAHEAFDIPIIALEGVDGAGKSMLLDTLSSDPDLAHIEFTGEFRSEVGRLLSQQQDWMRDPVLKLFAFAADRAFIFRELSKGARPKAIVWDRYVDSARVYREAEHRLKRSDYSATHAEEINRIFPKPILTLYLALSAAVASHRKKSDPELSQVVTMLYEEQARNNPTYFRLDASKHPEEVARDAKREILKVAPLA